MRATFWMLTGVALAAAMGVVPAGAAESYEERFAAACEQGPLIEVLLQHSFSAEKSRPSFCGCFISGIGELGAAEQDFVVRLLSTLESSGEDQQFYADTGQAVEIAFDACVASEGLDPPRD